MNNEIIYLKEVSSYDDILEKENNKLPLFLKKLIFLYKNIFNIVTKKKVENTNIWILPIKEKYYINKVTKIINKKIINDDNVYVISKWLELNQIHAIMEEKSQKYLTEEKVKKVLLIEVLKYISDIQKKEINSLEITMLVNNSSELNIYLIQEIAKLIKTLKIVSLNIHKFKKIEEKLYNEFGIPIQFSNSYKKSLEKSRLIINLDFKEIEINEYDIFNYAIIINCQDEKLKIKSKLFNGVIINSYDIGINKEITNNFKNMHLYGEYKKLLLYASIIEQEQDITKIIGKIKKDNINIINLIGNNGIINRKEFKNIDKKLDKNLKKE